MLIRIRTKMGKTLTKEQKMERCYKEFMIAEKELNIAKNKMEFWMKELYSFA